MITDRVNSIKPSPTFALDATVKQMVRQGMDVINLGLGEPDFETPENIKKAAIRAIRNGFTHYTQTEGILPLREAIVNKFKSDNAITYDPSEIIVSNGSKQILYTAFQVLIDKKSEVLIPVPAWGTYAEQVKAADGMPVFIKLEPPFKLTAKDIEKAVTDKTKVLLLNSPSNPTGAIIDPEELKKIVNIALKYKLWIIADEIYEKLIYTGKHLSIASINEEIKARTITINGLSKAYAMTGWRLGYAGGPKYVISKMIALQGQITSNASSISQMAGLEALKGDQKPLLEMLSELRKRRDFLIKELSHSQNLSFSAPEGAFYFYISVEKLLSKNYPDSTAWCKGLLETEKVAVVPGEAFDYPGYFRLSYANSMDNLKKAVNKINNFLKKNS